MTEAKWVRIMCDYCADPLWGPSGAMEMLEDLPVTDDLKERLNAWERIYDIREPDFKDDFDVIEFSKVGLGLAKEVKAQLPNWTVIYFDEAASAACTPNSPRETFEYEIKADND